MTERLYTTRAAGKLLGNLHPNDVLLLIRRGKLKAKKQCVRGRDKRPRKYVPASSIAAYIEALPDANDETETPEETENASRRGIPRDIQNELRTVRKYH